MLTRRSLLRRAVAAVAGASLAAVSRWMPGKVPATGDFILDDPVHVVVDNSAFMDVLDYEFDMIKRDAAEWICTKVDLSSRTITWRPVDPYRQST